jgi:hypothetical protein
MQLCSSTSLSWHRVLATVGVATVAEYLASLGLARMPVSARALWSDGAAGGLWTEVKRGAGCAEVVYFESGIPAERRSVETVEPPRKYAPSWALRPSLSPGPTSVRSIACGWPAKSHWYCTSTAGTAHGIRLSATTVAPTGLILQGWVVNVSSYSAVLVGLTWAARGLARRRRAHRGLCPACAYPLVGIATVCPECGTPVQTQDAVG